MISKKISLAAMLLLCTIATFAQTLPVSFSPTVQPSVGGYLSAGNLQLQFTIGEPLTGTFTASGLQFNFGFGQPQLNITLGSIAAGPYCAGTQIRVPFKAADLFGTTNIFTAQLSDSSGSFASPVTIGADTISGSSDTITANLPSTVTGGSNYRVRVVASTGGFVGGASGYFTINSIVAITPYAQSDTICVGSTAQINISNSQRGIRYNVMLDTIIISSGVGTDSLLSLSTGILDTTTAFTVMAVDSNTDCSLQLAPTLVITIAPIVSAPTFLVNNFDTLVCPASNIYYTAVASNCVSVLYSVISGGASIDSITGGISNVSSNFIVKATYVGMAGCSVISDSLFVHVTPIIAPDPPDSEFVSSDTAVYVAFSERAAAGCGGDQIEWATDSSFSGSTIATSPCNIRILVDTNSTVRVWLRSRNSATGLVSNPVTTQASNRLGGGPPPGSDDDDQAWQLFDNAGNLISQTNNISDGTHQAGFAGYAYLCNNNYTINFTDYVDAPPPTDNITAYGDLCGSLYNAGSYVPGFVTQWQIAITNIASGHIYYIYQAAPVCAAGSVFPGFTFSFPTTPDFYGYNKITILGVDNPPTQAYDPVGFPLYVTIIPNQWPSPGQPIISPASPFCSCANVCFSIRSPNPYNPLPPSYLNLLTWNFDDGTVTNMGCNTTDPDPSAWTCPNQICHEFGSPGTYNVTVSLNSPDPNPTVDCPPLSYTTQVTVVGPTVDFSFTSNTCSISFTSIPGGCTTGLNYSWNFGDGTISGNPNPSHTFAASGSYSVTLTISDACGNQATATHTINYQACCSGTTYEEDFTQPYHTVHLTFGDISASELIANQIIISGGTTAFNGKLTIDQDFSMDNCRSILFGPGAQVIIKPGKKLTITYSTLSACSALWKGIFVEGGGNLFILWSTIEDAQYAIQAGNKSKLSVMNCKFINNFVGCYFTGSVVIPSNITLSVFSGNEFYGNGFLKPNYIGMQNAGGMATPGQMNAWWSWAGVVVSGVNTLSLSGTPAAPNYFHDMANGIIDYNSNLNVSNDKFKNIQKYLYNSIYQGNAVLIACTANFNLNRTLNVTGLGQNFGNSNLWSFSNCYRGIAVYNANTIITQNTMIDNTGGNTSQVYVASSSNKKISIHDNNIETYNRGVSLYQNDPVLQLGVYNNNIKVYSLNGYIGSVGIETTEQGHAPGPPGEGIIYNHIYMENNALAGINAIRANGLYCGYNYVYLDQPTTNFVGIEFQGCTNIMDVANHVECTTTAVDQNTTIPFAPNYPVGILNANYMGNSLNNQHLCNVITNLYTGMRFTANNSNCVIAGNNFVNNSVSGHRCNIGLLVDLGASIAPQPDQGNTWTGTGLYNNSHAAHNANPSGIASTQKFTVSTGSYVPNTYDPANWFVPNSIVTPYACNVLPIGSGRAALNTMERRIADGSAQFDDITPALTWQNKMSVYQRLLDDTTLIDSTDVNTFYQQQNTTTLGAFAKMEAQDQAAILPDSISLKQLSTWQDSISALMARIALIDSQKTLLFDTARMYADTLRAESLAEWVSEDLAKGKFYTDTILQAALAAAALSADSIITDTFALNYLNSLADTLAGTVAVYSGLADSLGYVLDSVKYARVAAVTTANTAITPTNDIEGYYQQAYNVYLHTIALDNPVFDSTQLATLYNLAFLCPLIGGEATIKARSMLSLVTDTFYNDDSLCATWRFSGDSSRMLMVARPAATDTVQQKVELKAALYPNPARDYAVLQLNQDIAYSMQLKITDAVGSVVYNNNISFTSGTYNINTALFSDGIYFVSLNSSANHVFSGKLCILHK